MKTIKDLPTWLQELWEQNPNLARRAEKGYLELTKQGNITDVNGRSLLSEFWKESSDLIDKYREDGDERAAQGVVSCRILINGIMKRLEN